MNPKTECCICRESFDPQATQMYQRVTGWLRHAKKRGSLKGKKFDQDFACSLCVSAMDRAGTEWSQERLFEVES